MKGNMSDDFMATDGPSSDSSTELVTAFENGKKEPKRPSPRKMERVDSGSRRRPPTESSSSSSSGATTQPTKRKSLTPPRQDLSTAGGAQKTRSKAKALEEVETSGQDSRRFNASSHSPRRSARTATYTRSQSQSGLIVKETRSRDLSVDAATRRSRERSIDATYRRAHKRSLSKDRSTEAQDSTAQPSTHSPRSIRQNTVLDSLDTAIQRRAGRKPDSLSTSRHGDPSANSRQLGSSTHGVRRRASVPDSPNTSRHAESTGSQSHRDPTQSQLRRSLSDDHRKPYMESLDSSSHRRPARNKDPLGGSRHGPAPSQPNSVPHRSHSMEKSSTAADSRGMPPITGNQRRASKKDDVLGRSRHRDPTPAQGLNASSHRPRSRSGERRKQVAGSLGMVSQRRAARKDDLLGGSMHEPAAGGHTQRRSTGGIVHTPSTPSTTVKPNVDCFKNLSRLLSDSAVSPNKTDDQRGDANSQENDNMLMDLLTTDLTPKQLRRALRAHKKVEEAKSSKQQQEQQEQEQQNGNVSDEHHMNGDPYELDKLGIVLDPSTSFEQDRQTSNAVEQDLTVTKQANPLGSSVEHADSTTAANNFSSNNETTTTTLPRPRQMRRHTMDHAPKQNLDPEPTTTGSLRDSRFQRSTSFGAFEEEQEEDNDDNSNRPPRHSTTGHHQVSTKRRFGKRSGVQLEAMKRDRDNRKQSVKDSILSILDE